MAIQQDNGEHDGAAGDSSGHSTDAGEHTVT